MTGLFFIPLCWIALFESSYHRRVEPWLRGDDEAPDDHESARNPNIADHEENGMKISKVPFDDIVKAFPDSSVVSFIL